MKCFQHHEADAVGYCRQCGKALCEACRREVRGVIYCEDCLAASVLGGAPAVPGAPNPGAALALGFIPGVGAIYNGEYVKGVLHIIIFFGLIAMADTARGPFEPMFGMLAAAFYFYMIIDAYRTAKRRQAGEPVTSTWETLGFGGNGSTTPVGPLILIVLGVLFLFSTLDIFDRWWDEVLQFWPVALIAIGVYLLWRRTGGARSGSPPESPGPPGGPPGGSS